MPTHRQIKKILVRSTNWIGDAVMTTPALAVLRRCFPQASITVAARPWVAPVFEHNPRVDNVMHIDDHRGLAGRFSIAGALRHESFDLALVLPNSFGSALAIWLAGIPLRAGYTTDYRGMLFNRGIAPPAWKSSRHEIFYYINLVTKALHDFCTEDGRETLHGEPELELNVDRASRQWAEDMLARRGIGPDHTLIGFNPGAAYGPAKCWPVENFQSLGRMLSCSAGISKTGARIAVLGTEKERDTAEEICSSLGAAGINLAGSTTLPQVFALIERMDLLVTNDSGLMHVGAALGTPLVALFGSTNPDTTGPWARRARVVTNPVECAPCMKRQCSRDFQCLKGLAPRDVFQACLEQIQVAER